MDIQKLKRIVEGALLAANQPLGLEQLEKLFLEGEERPTRAELREALALIEADCEGRGFELKEVASGWRFQVRQELSTWVGRLWEERPPRYSRAFLETLALIAYRQPITRAEIEDVRGVAVSTNIVKTLQERDWIRVVGHKDVPGKPAMYGTTRAFLDYFNLKSLDELPTLAELRDLDKIHPELAFEEGVEAANEPRPEGEVEGEEEAIFEATEETATAEGETEFEPEEAGSDWPGDEAGSEGVAPTESEEAVFEPEDSGEDWPGNGSEAPDETDETPEDDIPGDDIPGPGDDETRH